MPFPPRRAGTGLALTFAAAMMPLTEARADDYPHVPEPMIFDMMRPLGAKRGELEANTLVTSNLSGPGKKPLWAPEVEYAVADGFAVELELPFEGDYLAELKYGLQAAFGTLNGGRSAHGIQYIGVYDRHAGRYHSTAAYMLVTRFNARWSHVGMIGFAEIGRPKRKGNNAFITNHSLFFDNSEKQVLGVEINYRGGEDRSVRVMPQIHQILAPNFSVQMALGAGKERGEPVRPQAGIRVITQF